MEVKLACGFEYEEKLYNIAEVNEMTGQQQEYLVKFENLGDDDSTIDHIPMILDDLFVRLRTDSGDDCPVPLKEVYWSLPVEDIYLLILGIRRETWGDIYALPTKCPSCNKTNKVAINLSEIEASPLGEETVILPKSEEEITIKPTYLREIMSYEKYIKTHRGKLNRAHLISKTLALSIKDKTPEDLRKLSLSDNEYLKEKVGEFNRTIDTDSQNVCVSCGEEFVSAIPVMNPAFFFQSQTPTIGYLPTTSTTDTI